MRSACFKLKFKRLVFKLKRLVSKPGAGVAAGGGWGKQANSEKKHVSGGKTNVLRGS